MKPLYTVVIYTPQELNHSSYVQTGLFELEQLGIIKVKVKLNISTKIGRTIISKDGKIIQTKQPHPKTSFYKLLNNSTNESIRFATDLYDLADHFSTIALEQCDFIFKRNYEDKYIKYLPIEYKNKIHKLGLTFGVHSKFKRENSVFFIGMLVSNLIVSFKPDRLLFKRLLNSYKAQLREWKFVNTSRKINRFETYTKSINSTIFFQTRCFPHEFEEDVKSIHIQRYNIIKLLRKTFTYKFLGGFVPSKISNSLYKDALSNVPSNPELYLDALKNSKIVIYTRGLANSPAWKMAEYLSQGKVIMAEHLTAELPIPLKNNQEVMFFNSEEELLLNIKKVLKDEILAEKLANNARTYFEINVHPIKNMNRIIEIMINNTKN